MKINTASALLPPVLFVAFTGIALCGQTSIGGDQSWTLQSPNHNILVRISGFEKLTYAVEFEGRSVIADSALGLEFQGVEARETPLKLKSKTEEEANTSWTTNFGKNSPVRNHFRQLRLSFTGASTPTGELELLLRAYDNGVAFRYQLGTEGISGGKEFTVTREKTEFRFASDPTVWAATYEGFSHAYEHEYPRAKLSSIYPSALVGLPLLVQSDATTYVGLTEADLTDWAGLYLRRVTTENATALSAALSPRLDGNGMVRSRLPRHSPWRVLMIGNKPGELIESDLVTNLNPPSAIADESWIKPGKMAWDHWWSGDVQVDNETEKRFIQFASDMGFPYQLVDWQWYGPFNKVGADITRPAALLDFPGLLRFASDRHVRLWLWLHSGDVDRAMKTRTLDEAFTVYQHWGIAGVKIDFMNRDDQDMVNWYQTVVELAARHHLMVDFHGAFKPTGLRRTWPNLLTREGVLGNEYNKFSGRVTPEHKLTLPFTRMLAGPMDYTPGGFLNRSVAEWKQRTPTEVMGSRAQELALFVVYESPLTCVTDDPVHYKDQHGDQPGLEFLRVVPTVWNETRVLDGVVGRHIVIARRNGKEWFVGGMTGDDAYTFQLMLSFLGPSKYKAQIFADPEEPTASYEAVKISTKSVSSQDSMLLRMRPAGGFAIYFRAE